MNMINLISNKRIALALGMIIVVAAIVVSGTGAFFSDSETSANNVFTAGSIDLKVDHEYASYNGEVCTSNCTPDGNELVTNGGFENPTITAGNYTIFTGTNLPGWTVVSGDGIEVQNNAAGAPHGGLNLVELDSTSPSVMSQDVVTTAGQKYRLSFWYSPRPNVPSGENEIGYEVSVVSNNVVIASETVGETAVGAGNTVWELVTVDFVAQSASTKIVFSDEGDVSNSLGGYIDDVSVRQLTCAPGEYEDTPGGFCELWAATNLTDESFFNFMDVKPGDEGVNVMSLHVETNDAFVCAFAHNIVDLDNTLTEPEAAVPDTLVDGELDDVLEFMIWKDDGDGDYELAEGSPIVPAGSDIEDFDLGALTIAAGNTSYLGIAWCAGDQTLSGDTITCDGASETNVSQTDSLSASLTLYAIQQRNNAGFSCEDVEIPGVTDGGNSGGNTDIVTLKITPNDLAGSLASVISTPSKWYFHNDSKSGDPVMTTNQFTSTGGSNEIVAGPTGATAGGAAKMILDSGTDPIYVGDNVGKPRYNIATYQFKDVKLADIDSLTYRIFDSSASGEKPYLQFNVDFNNSDTWQRRLVQVPTIPVGVWTEVDAIGSGATLWTHSGATWPAGIGEPGTTPGTTAKSWTTILTTYPNAETRSTDSFFGVRVGHPGPVGEESYVDWIEFDGTKFDFGL